ncbi:MAG: hypothetical protein ACLR7W_21575 [Ruminococcus sp.]
MAEVTIPKEKMNYTIDLLITMVTDEIAEETGKDRNEVLTDFCVQRQEKHCMMRRQSCGALVRHI